jgi:hypothetical protein
MMRSTRGVPLWRAFSHALRTRAQIGNCAAEGALRGIAIEGKAWLFAGSDRGAERATIMLTLIQTAKLNRRRSTGLARRRGGQALITRSTIWPHYCPWNWRLARIDRVA